MADLRLTGYGPSVYSRTVRIALYELGQPFDWVEADPFDDEGRAALRGLHPFARVPVLQHGAVTVYETRAILAYLVARFRPGEVLRPLAAARAVQVQGIVDAYGYWPLVRQVYSHGVFRPASGEPHDERKVTAGLAAAVPVLDALETIAREGLVLTGDECGPADWHLAPVIDAFAQVPAAAAMLAERPGLATWFAAVAARASMAATAWHPEGRA